jgi:hypothetical protein
LSVTIIESSPSQKKEKKWRGDDKSNHLEKTEKQQEKGKVKMRTKGKLLTEK